MVRAGKTELPGLQMMVFSRTLRQRDYPGVTIVTGEQQEAVTALRAETGKDIWLFGGGSLFRSLLEDGLMDTVEVSIIPVLLGGRIPLLPPPARQSKLKLASNRICKSGIVSLAYRVG